MSGGTGDASTCVWLCPDCTEARKDTGMPPAAAQSLSEDRVSEHRRMQTSSFWMFFWNHVYNKETEPAPRVSATTRDGDAKGYKPRARGTPPGPAVSKVAQELIDKFETVRIALISTADANPETQAKGIHYKDSMIFENGPAIQWTVERCKIFQDALVKDCEKNDRRSRPVIVPAQHCVLKLPADFKSGEYSVGVVEYDEELSGTVGMFFTARDVDALHVFEASVLEHEGTPWEWGGSGEKSEFADHHGFHRLINGKFMCENEPNKALHENETRPDEFGRNTVWIQMQF